MAKHKYLLLIFEPSTTKSKDRKSLIYGMTNNQTLIKKMTSTYQYLNIIFWKMVENISLDL